MNTTILKIVVTTAVFTLIGSAHRASADYSVVLKNNRKFIVSDYWEENNEIRFRLSNGIIGIQKDYIKQIKKLSLDVTSVPSKVETKTTRSTNQTETFASDANSHNAQADAIPSENREVIDPSLAQEFNRLEERVRDVQMLANAERHDLARDLFSFRKRLMAKVSEEGLTPSYGDLLQNLATMESKIDSFLVSRSR